MSDKLVTMKQYNGSSYDNIYPATKIGQISDIAVTSADNDKILKVVDGNWAIANNSASGWSIKTITGSLIKEVNPSYSNIYNIVMQANCGDNWKMMMTNFYWSYGDSSSTWRSAVFGTVANISNNQFITCGLSSSDFSPNFTTATINGNIVSAIVGSMH